MRRLLAPVFLAVQLLAGPAGAQVPAGVLIATEVVPVGDPLAPAPPAPSWAAAEALARQAALLVPEAARAVGVDGARIETQVIAGGAFLETSPTLLLRTRLSFAEAERLAAALGFVFRSPAAIVADLGAAEGDSAFGLVALPGGRATPAQAQAFFSRAAETTEGLGTSYLALPEGLLFLNLRDPDGQPIAGLDDENFLEALKDTAAGARARIVASGSARVRVVWNDWVAAPNGEEHLARTGPTAAAALGVLRDRHAAAVRAMAKPAGR